MNAFKLLLALFLVAGFTSCSDDDNEEDLSIEANRIVGEWKIQSLSIDGENVPLNDCEAQTTIKFLANGNLTSTNFFEDFETEECLSEVSNEKWEYLGNDVYKFIDGSESLQAKVTFSNNNNQFTFTDASEDEIYAMTYVKI